MVSLLSLLNSMDILHLWRLQYLWSSLQLRPTFTSSQLVQEPCLGNPTMPQVSWPQRMFRILVQVPRLLTLASYAIRANPAPWTIAEFCCWLRCGLAKLDHHCRGLCSFMAEPEKILPSSAWLKQDAPKLFFTKSMKGFQMSLHCFIWEPWIVPSLCPRVVPSNHLSYCQVQSRDFFLNTLPQLPGLEPRSLGMLMPYPSLVVLTSLIIIVGLFPPVRCLLLTFFKKLMFSLYCIFSYLCAPLSAVSHCESGSVQGTTATMAYHKCHCLQISSAE